MVPMSELIKSITQNPLFRRQVPLEWRLSVPLPDRSSGELRFRCFLFPCPALKDRPRPVGAPRAVLTVSADGSRILEYSELAAPAAGQGASGPIGYAPHDAIASWDAARLREARNAMYAAIAKLADQPWTETPDAAAVSALSLARSTLLEPCLLPHYDSIAPAFWQWLRVPPGAV